jgi:hypothetical protein
MSSKSAKRLGTALVGCSLAVVVIGATAAPALALTTPSASNAPKAVATPSATSLPSVPVRAGGGISLRPLNPDPAVPSSAAYFTLAGALGSTLRESVVVSNTDTKAVTLDVTPVDGLTGSTSGSVYANRLDPIAANGRWVTVSQPTVLLGPGASAVVPFTVAVPSDAAAGDHLAGVAFENANPVVSKGGFQVTEVVRSVIGVLTVVPGPATFHPKLISLGIAQIGQTGLASVIVKLEDDGLKLGKPLLTVKLDGANGYTKTLSRQLDTLLPGDAIEFPFPWPDSLATGDYNITATLTGGGDTVTLTTDNVQVGTKLIGVAVPPKVVPVAVIPAKHGLNTALVAGGSAAIALLLAGLAFFLGKRLRRRSHRARLDGFEPDGSDSNVRPTSRIS